MFTGLIQHLGTVRSIEPIPAGRRLLVDAKGWSHRPAIGSSIAVNGCCLTVADGVGEPGLLGFDVIAQTLALTALGDLEPGRRVNLESAVTPETLLGGHIVQGHVDGTARVVAVQADDGDYRVRFDLDPALARFVFSQGSIALAGVSMTVAAMAEDASWAEVALIPTTRRETTLGGLRVGDRVNVEVDYLVRAVVLTAGRSGVTAGR